MNTFRVVGLCDCDYLCLLPLEAGRGKALGKRGFEMHQVTGGHVRLSQRWADKLTCDTHTHEMVKNVNMAKSVRLGSLYIFLGSCLHLSCKTNVAERQGRSSRVWRSSTAVPAVTREGSRSTKSSTTAGLFHANNYRDRQRKKAENSCIPRLV